MRITRTRGTAARATTRTRAATATTLTRARQASTAAARRAAEHARRVGADTVADTDADTDAVTVTDAVTDAVTVADTVADADADTVTDVDAVAVADTHAVADDRSRVLRTSYYHVAPKHPGGTMAQRTFPVDSQGTAHRSDRGVPSVPLRRSSPPAASCCWRVP